MALILTDEQTMLQESARGFLAESGVKELRRVLNTPKRGIGDRAQACIAALAERDRITFWEALTRAESAPGLATRSDLAVASRSAVLPEPGEPIRLSASMPRAAKCSRLCAAWEALPASRLS